MTIVVCTIIATLVAQRLVQRLIMAWAAKWIPRVRERVARRASGERVPIEGFDRWILNGPATEAAFVALVDSPLETATPEDVFGHWLTVRYHYDVQIGRRLP